MAVATSVVVSPIQIGLDVDALVAQVGSNPNGAVIALVPDDPEAIAISGAEDASLLHVTLCFLADDANLISLDARALLLGGLMRIAEEYPPQDLTVFGVAELNGNTPDAAVVLLTEAPGMGELCHETHELTEALDLEYSDHEFYLPHMTVGYGIDPGAADPLQGAVIRCSSLVAWFGPERHDFPLTGLPEEATVVTTNPPTTNNAGTVTTTNGFSGTVELRTEAAAPTDPGADPMQHSFVDADGDGNCDVCGQPEAAHTAASAEDEEPMADFAIDNERWRGVLVVEGVPSGDERLIDPGALTWRELPLPLMLKTKNEGEGHDGAELAGRIETIDRQGTKIVAEGSLDNGEAGRELKRLSMDGMLRGVSVDLDSVEIEWENQPPGADAPIEDLFDFDPGMMIVTSARVMGATVTPFPAFQEAYLELFDPNQEAPVEAKTLTAEVNPDDVAIGDSVMNGDRSATVVGIVPDPPTIVVQPDDSEPLELWPASEVTPADAAPAAPAKPGAPGFETNLDVENLSELADAVDGLVASAAPAWDDPIAPVSIRAHTPLGQSLVAAAAPVHPPAAWFEKPGLAEVAPVRVSAEGHVFGYVARWSDCHTGYAGRCRRPPRSPSNYAKFRTGQTMTAEGTLIATGRICCDTVHPQLKMIASDAASFYADTGCVVADVAVYEDEVGILVAGACRPTATPEQVRILRASDVSPDWREFNGTLDCVAMLCVNASGFVVDGLVASARVPSVLFPRGHVNAEGHVTALVAAGMVMKSRPEQPDDGVLAARVEELEARLHRMTMAMAPELARQGREKLAQLRSAASA